MTTLEQLAATHRLRVTRDAYHTRIVAGRAGSLIVEYDDDGRLSVLLMGTSARWWNGRRAALVAAGARLEQDGDSGARSRSIRPTRPSRRWRSSSPDASDVE